MSAPATALDSYIGDVRSRDRIAYRALQRRQREGRKGHLRDRGSGPPKAGIVGLRGGR